MPMLRFLFSLVLFSLVCLVLIPAIFPPPGSRAWAQAARLQDVPEGRLVRNEDGFALDLAGGFELGKYLGGYYLLGSRSTPGLILVKALPGLTATELNRNLRSGYTDRTVRLTPDGMAAELDIAGGAGKLVEVRGFLYEGEVRGLLAGYLRPAGGGLLLFAVTTPEQWPQLQPVAEQVARSVSLFDPDPQEMVRTWKERLSGFQLIHAPDADAAKDRAQGSAGGKQAYSLCGDGSFLYEQDAGAAWGSPADRAAGRRDGTWEIVPQQHWAELVLVFRDGRKQSYRLSRDEHETYLDDQRYFVVSKDHCP
jgi:hypothetical protein